MGPDDRPYAADDGSAEAGSGAADAAERVYGLAPRPGPQTAALIAPADEIFDAAAVSAELSALAREPLETGPMRAAAAKILRAALARGRDRIERAFFTERRSGLGAARSIAWLTDRLVEGAFGFAAERLFPSLTSSADRLSVIGVGGYGRGEMAPFSDVDLLFLTPYKESARDESVIEATLYTLWDMRLKVGHATRGLEDCVRAAKADMTIRTSLLEARAICGDEALAADLKERLWTGLFAATGPEFVAAKLAERDERHGRTGGSRYLLEPNVKESKGGLRDVQTLFWIAKYLYRAEDLDGLIDKGVFTRGEAQRCRSAEAHLWTVRCALHYLAGRAQEKLGFDHQVELAERFGYRESAGQRPVERFMKRYFMAAKEVGDLTRIFCAALEQQHKKSPPLLGGLRRLFAANPSEVTDKPWASVRDGRVAVSDAAAFLSDPIHVLELVSIGVDTGLLVHPDALRLVSTQRRAIDDAVRSRPDVRARLLDLMTISPDPTRALRRLSETGVLQRFIPEFQRVTGLMQFNMYHHFTVDEHSIQTLEQMHKLRAGALSDVHPEETEIVRSFSDMRVPMVAAFLHDIGKGLREDHSVAGARLAEEICADLGMSAGEIANVVWLVRHHLAMSDTAQKRDIADPKTVRAFADLVRSPGRLKQLYALTVCDIRAVGPGVWNSWKAQLLRQLYVETRAMLIGEDPALSRHQRAEAAQAAVRDSLPDWADAAWARHVARFPASYWLGLDAETLRAHAVMMSGPAGLNVAPPAPDALTMEVVQAPARDATEVSFYSADHPGLFARMAGALALSGASVVEARATTTRDGMAVNTFWVQDPGEDEDARATAYDDPHRLERLRESVERSLAGRLAPREALRARRKLKRREKSFEVAPSVAIDNAASDVFTVIEVNGRDRIGLLYNLARALSAENANIHSAIIATYGEHAVDVFYVKDIFGMKIVSEAKHRRLEHALLSALEQVAEQD